MGHYICVWVTRNFHHYTTEYAPITIPESNDSNGGISGSDELDGRADIDDGCSISDVEVEQDAGGDEDGDDVDNGEDRGGDLPKAVATILIAGAKAPALHVAKRKQVNIHATGDDDSLDNVTSRTGRETHRPSKDTVNTGVAKLQKPSLCTTRALQVTKAEVLWY